jgi:hypothetical protein
MPIITLAKIRIKNTYKQNTEQTVFISTVALIIILITIIIIMCRDSAVGIATGYGLDE